MKLAAGWFRRDRGLAIGVVNGALTVGVALPFLFRALGAYAGVDWRPVVVAASVAAVAGALLVGCRGPSRAAGGGRAALLAGDRRRRVP